MKIRQEGAFLVGTLEGAKLSEKDRQALLAMGNEDQLFDYIYSVASFERLKEMCSDVGTDWVTFDIFDGTHEFFKYDEPIQKRLSK